MTLKQIGFSSRVARGRGWGCARIIICLSCDLRKVEFSWKRFSHFRNVAQVRHAQPVETVLQHFVRSRRQHCQVLLSGNFPPKALLFELFVAAQDERISLSLDPHHRGLALVPPRSDRSETGNGRGSIRSKVRAGSDEHRRLKHVGPLFGGKGRRNFLNDFFC